MLDISACTGESIVASSLPGLKTNFTYCIVYSVCSEENCVLVQVHVHVHVHVHVNVCWYILLGCSMAHLATPISQ